MNSSSSLRWFGICQRLAGVGLEELICGSPLVEGVRVAGRNVIAIQPSTRHSQRLRDGRVSSNRLDEQIQVMPELRHSKMFTDGFQGFLGCLLTSEATPRPVLSSKQGTSRTQFCIGFLQPILSPLRHRLFILLHRLRICIDLEHFSEPRLIQKRLPK